MTVTSKVQSVSLKTNIFILFIIDTSKSEESSIEQSLLDNFVISIVKYLVIWKMVLNINYKVGKRNLDKDS